MIIVWAGLGPLGVLLMAGGAGIGATLPGGGTLTAGIGLVIGSIGAYFLGIYLNQTKPMRELAIYMDSRAAQLHAAAAAGMFNGDPRFPTSTSIADAHQQVDVLLFQEYELLKKKERNRNTFFFIPMQYMAIAGVVAGLIMIVTDLAR